MGKRCWRGAPRRLRLHRAGYPEVGVCHEDVCWGRRRPPVSVPAFFFGCQRAGGRKASLRRAMWAGPAADPLDGLGAGGPVASFLQMIYIPQVCAGHAQLCLLGCLLPRCSSGCVTTCFPHHPHQWKIRFSGLLGCNLIIN